MCTQCASFPRAGGEVTGCGDSMRGAWGEMGRSNRETVVRGGQLYEAVLDTNQFAESATGQVGRAELSSR